MAALMRRVLGRVVGREREVELVVAALAADRHVLLEGPPGTGKSTLLRAVADELGLGFEFVEGNAELTPARLIGHFDPARVLTDGYDPDVFVDGPLVSAMRDGSLLYIEEINRIPEETLNVLITVMSERELHVPRLSRIAAEPGFRLVAAMNPFDAIGTARISSAVYDRVCRLAVGYQTAGDEAAIVSRGSHGSTPDSDWLEKTVEVVRRTRTHPEVRIGSSVRGAIDAAAVAASLSELRGVVATDRRVGLDAAVVALSGRLRLREGSTRNPDDIVTEIWFDVFGRESSDGNEASGTGKSPRPDGGRPDELTPDVKEGEAADDAVSDAQRRTTSRRDLARNPRFEQISPEVGELDEAAVEEGLVDDPDEMLAMLADLTGATDPKLRELARRLAARLFLDLARRGPAHPRGIGSLRELPYRPDRGDLDIDASLEAIVEGRARGLVDVDRLRVRGWVRPGTALCLLVDRSGSMGGKPLATAAIAAAAVASRVPADYSVLAFGKDVVVAKGQDSPKPSERVVTDLLALRGFGTTDLAGALRVAAMQLGRSRAARKITVVLSDCRSTVDGDPVAAAVALGEVVVVAPDEDADEARAFAASVGAAFTTVTGPSAIADALARVLA